jgi:hypothetical protein
MILRDFSQDLFSRPKRYARDSYRPLPRKSSHCLPLRPGESSLLFATCNKKPFQVLLDTWPHNNTSSSIRSKASSAKPNCWLLWLSLIERSRRSIGPPVDPVDRQGYDWKEARESLRPYLYGDGDTIGLYLASGAYFEPLRWMVKVVSGLILATPKPNVSWLQVAHMPLRYVCISVSQILLGKISLVPNPFRKSSSARSIEWGCSLSSFSRIT